MRRVFATLALALVLFAPTSVFAQSGGRLALLIGNQNYSADVGPLKNPINDIHVVGNALKEVGFEIVASVENGSREDILDAVHDFGVRLQREGKGAVGFIYYTGHGVAVEDQNILVPTNIPDTSDRSISVRGVALKSVVDTLVRLAPTAVHFVVIDACRNNLGGQRGAKGLAPYVDDRTGMVIAFATAAGATASDQGGKSGPYALALSEEITKVGKTDQEVFNAVRSRVVEQTSGSQVPWTHDGLIGDRIIFKPKPASDAAAKPLPNPHTGLTEEQQAEIVYWNTAQEGNDPTQIQAYLKRYPTGMFADLAILKIERTNREQQQRDEQTKRENDAKQADLAKREAEAKQQEALQKAAAAEAGRQQSQLKQAQEEAKAAQEALKLAEQKRAEAEQAALSAKQAAETVKEEREAQDQFEKRAQSEWDRLQNSSDIDALRTFQKSFDKSSFAERARARIALLTQPPASGSKPSSGGVDAPAGNAVTGTDYSTLRANLATASVLRSVRASPDGKTIAVAGDDGLIRIVDTHTFRLIRQLPEKSDGVSAHTLAYSSDGSELLSGRFDGNFEIWETATGQKLDRLKSRSDKIYSVAYYPFEKDRYLAVAGSNGLEIWNMKRKQMVGHPGLHQGAVRALSYSTLESGNFVSGGADGQLVFYLPGNRQKPVQAHHGAVFAVSYSSDNKSVISAGADGLVKVWDAETQSVTRTLSGHSRYVLSLALAQSGALVASGGADKTVRVWSVSDGSSLATFEGHQEDVEGVAFLNQDTEVASISEDKTLRVWDIATKKQILTAAFYADGDYVAYTPSGRYTGTEQADKRLELIADGQPRSLKTEDQAALRVDKGLEGLVHLK